MIRIRGSVRWSKLAGPEGPLLFGRCNAALNGHSSAVMVSVPVMVSSVRLLRMMRLTDAGGAPAPHWPISCHYLMSFIASSVP
jgi:hypothetical protein